MTHPKNKNPESCIIQICDPSGIYHFIYAINAQIYHTRDQISGHPVPYKVRNINKDILIDLIYLFRKTGMERTTPIGNAEFRDAKKYWHSVTEVSHYTLQHNNEVRFAAKFSIILCVEASAQIGRHILHEIDMPLPFNNIEVFIGLSNKHIISERLANRLIELVKFRNRLVHDYAGVDIRKMQRILYEGLPVIEEFQEIALNWERSYKGKSFISQMLEGAGIKTVIRSIFNF